MRELHLLCEMWGLPRLELFSYIGWFKDFCFELLHDAALIRSPVGETSSASRKREYVLFPTRPFFYPSSSLPNVGLL